MNSEECWVEIEEFPNYAISDFGRVMNVRTRLILKPIVGHGYLLVNLGNTNGFKLVRIHRLVVEAFLGPIFEGFEPNHIDGNKTNNYISNLELVTHSENIKHAYRLGLRTVAKPRIKVRCKETGEIFNFMTNAAYCLKIKQGHISEVINGYRKTAGGYTFELAN